MDKNRKRILAEALSVDAWHDPFKIDGTTSAVHVEVSFHEGRLGGNDPMIPFTFRIALRKALLTVKIEEPLSIKRSSVSRDIPETPAELTKILSAKQTARSSASLAGKLDPSSLSLALSGELMSGKEASKDQQLKVVQEIPKILAISRPRSPTEYAWELQPAYHEFLDGQPWDPIKSPRLEVRHPSVRQAIDPTIKVILSCALEDLSISSLEPKPQGAIEAIKNAAKGSISYAAAIQYLKRTLINADLEVGKFDNRFSDLWIADVLSQEEMPE